MIQLPRSLNKVVKQAKPFDNALDALKYCENLYNDTTTRMKECALNGVFSSDFFYPYILIEVTSNKEYLELNGNSHNQTEYYGNTITQPKLLANAYLRHIEKITANKDFTIWVGESNYPLSLAFVCEDLFNNLNISESMPCTKRIRTGMQKIEEDTEIKKLGLFHAEHIDYFLNRIHHYCGTSAEYFQENMIFTNYKMYVDFFIEDGKKLVDDGIYSSLIGPDFEYSKSSKTYKKDCYLPQMPAYHLVKEDGSGITIINVGVGPTNAKTITDHLAALSPQSWLMLGHCAGLDAKHQLGDYVLAQDYVRFDFILDKHVCHTISIPSSDEIIRNLQYNVSQHKIDAEKVYEGTIITTADRNWELQCDMVNEFASANAIAVDMESATIAANAFRFSIPCASFLCISDVPLHGKPKLRGMARGFYKTKVRQHFKVGIAAITDLSQSNSSQNNSKQQYNENSYYKAQHVAQKTL